MNGPGLIKNSVLIILAAENFNEEEFLIINDSLEKKGIKIFIASDSNNLCTGKHGLKVKNDIKFFNIHERNFAGIIFIGGSGIRNYWDNKKLHQVVKDFFNAKKPVAAICSSVVILARAGILSGLSAACWKEDIKELQSENIQIKDAPVISRKNVITGSGPDSSTEFVETFISRLSI